MTGIFWPGEFGSGFGFGLRDDLGRHFRVWVDVEGDGDVQWWGTNQGFCDGQGQQGIVWCLSRKRRQRDDHNHRRDKEECWAEGGVRRRTISCYATWDYQEGFTSQL